MMHCETYNCDMRPEACVARQENARCKRWGRPGADDPNCVDCAQGKAIAAATAGEDVDTYRQDLHEVRQRAWGEEKTKMPKTDKSAPLVCKRCGNDRAVGEFRRVRGGGRAGICEECRAAARADARKKKTAAGKDAPAAKPDNGNRAPDAYAGDALLSELFGENDLLLDGLHELADRELRTPRNQLLYLVQTATKEMTHGA